MASKRICPHTIMLYNYIGEDRYGTAKYSCTLLRYVHAHINKGIGSGNVANDRTRVHIFDTVVKCDKTFLPYHEWAKLDDESKVNYWTLCDEGKDYFSQEYSHQGSMFTSINLDTSISGLFRITLVTRLCIGNKRMHHWRIEAR